MYREIKFGVRIPAFPLDQESGDGFGEDVVRFVSGLNPVFDSVWVADHFVPWYEAQDPMTNTLEAWTTLTYLAGMFQHFRFGNIVLSQSYRSPALLAKMGATLQFLSGGRFIMGIGAGWKEDEYLSYGYAFPKTATRIFQLAEAVKIIQLMWSEARATFTGDYYQIKDAICEPKPVPRPPILIGGGGRKYTLRVVAESADWWNYPGGTAVHYGELLEVLRRHCEVVGRDYDEIVKTWASECVAVAGTNEAAIKIAKRTPFYNPETAIVGNAETVAEKLRQFTELGVRHFILRFADFPAGEGAERFAQEVIPLF